MRPPEIAFTCPACGKEACASLDGRGRCARCHGETAFELSSSLREKRLVDVCPVCAGKQLYVQRDFNQRAGLAIVGLGAVLAPFTRYYWSLIAAALVDAALYAMLPEIAVCYRCHAHFRGFSRNPIHEAFDLHVAEQYDPRKEPT